MASIDIQCTFVPSHQSEFGLQTRYMTNSFIEAIIIVMNRKNRHTDVLNEMPGFIYDLNWGLFIVIVSQQKYIS